MHKRRTKRDWALKSSAIVFGFPNTAGTIGDAQRGILKGRVFCITLVECARVQKRFEHRTGLSKRLCGPVEFTLRKPASSPNGFHKPGVRVIRKKRPFHFWG